jgi:hypothetical protein
MNDKEYIDKLRGCIKEVVEWLFDNGFINDIHYDEQGLIDYLNKALTK